MTILSHSIRDEFQLLLAASTSSEDIDASNQVVTQVNVSQLAELWVPKDKTGS